ncbi:hypothetical protein ACRE_089120 [Hapsidospora chrysogenum ATCC 11550]|uniref:Uncharacterized protein n=1 Tax=Hapsidospora chrysogenum (strain ATCC 11550 / CBS 779.69 / DSM 880 / IAM 14645 / JCM 23072 / IMI 49137) TaxID=857340 RepID=A0A086STJ4_HAPC1|nr:hypothetical protein ACRE_089120 [Hapsidospora chrysogenum ATCC 11550]
MGLPTFSSSSSAEDKNNKNTAETTTTAAQSSQQQQATGAGANTGAGVTREKTAAEKEADRLYEERMEDEYAKREGGS